MHLPPQMFSLFSIFLMRTPKYPNQLHTQLRVGRSSLNCHLYPIGLSNTKSCPCGFANESVEHFLLSCPRYDNARLTLFQRLSGLLENTYSKQTLTQILLCGEKPHVADKYTHNKFIAFAVQAFILKTKRLIAYNKPNAPPTHESD